MCKCCQSCLETIYWHLIEKHFCYDESIALYEEPEKEEKNNNLFVTDNTAFYDRVAVIAGRSVVTIDPLPEKPKPPVVQQPTKKIRWWESDSPYPSSSSEDIDKKSVPEIKVTSEESTEDITDSKSEDSEKPGEKLDDKKESTEEIKKDTRDITDSKDTKIVDENTTDKTTPREKEETAQPPSVSEKPQISYPKVKKRSLPKNKHLERAQTISTITDGVKSRKQSLHERRLSRSLTLNLDSHAELPVIRQASMPKFYLDTPEENQMERTSIYRAPSSALTSPVLPNKNLFDFDLRSVVQMENEKLKEKAHQSPNQNDEKSTRLAHIREKLNPLKIIRQGSLSHLPHASHHM